MNRSNPKAKDRIQELLQKPRTFIESEFSPYFYRYFNRYRNPKKFGGYLCLCQYLFRVTKAKDASVLDLGCGFGLMATIFGLYGSREVVGYDLNEEKIQLFRKMLSYLNSEIKNVKPVLGDSSKIEYPGEYFDVIIANETLSHVRDTEASIHEVYRVLKPGGAFLIRDGNNSLFLLGKIKRRRFWRRIERGPVDPKWFRSTDISLPFVEVRQKMILDKFPEMDAQKAMLLSKKTVGMWGVEIFEAVREFKERGEISNCPKFRYRNPITGEYPEKEINPFRLGELLKKRGFEVFFTPYFYSESLGNLEMIVKRIYYLMEKNVTTLHLFLTPGFTLLSKKVISSNKSIKVPLLCLVFLLSLASVLY
jgi:ubiquinone/menaquinone biosynthesis C-methylase UbiE